MSVWVLKSDGKYLAPTVHTKFRHVTMGDCVPEQAYACRYYDRNAAVALAVELNGVDYLDRPNPWRIIRLRPKMVEP